MPFEKLTGPECWDMEAVMPDKSWNDSGLSSELCSDAKYAEIQKIANYFSFESFGEFHDAYLHTDMALADVLEAYREAFFENYGLDPVLYVTGASAAWDAMLKRCVGKNSPLQLISDRKIYEITRASVRGGLSNPFQPYAKANNPGLGGPLPVDGGVLLTLAGDKKTRLKDLNKLLLDTDYESVDFSETHLVQVTYYVPLHAHERIDWAPPARMSISTSQLSEYSKELLRRRGLEKAPQVYMEKFEVRICDVHTVIRFKCRPFMRPFIEDCYARRLLLKKAGRKLQDKVLKTTMCVQFGKSVQNQEHFRNVEVFVDRAVYERELASRHMVDFHAHPSSAGFFGVVQTKKFKGALLKSVPQIGTFVLDEARLGIMRNHYGFREIFDGGLTKPVDPSYSLAERSCMRAIYTDTDSDILQVYSEEHPSVKLARANVEGKGPCFWVVALGPKSYSEWLTDSVKFFHKFKSKGMAKLHRKQLTHEAYRKNHVVNLVRVEKLGLCAFTDKGTKKLPREIVDQVLSFVVGRGGYLSCELVDDGRWVGKIKGLVPIERLLTEVPGPRDSWLCVLLLLLPSVAINLPPVQPSSVKRGLASAPRCARQGLHVGPRRDLLWEKQGPTLPASSGAMAPSSGGSGCHDVVDEQSKPSSGEGGILLPCRYSRMMRQALATVEVALNNGLDGFPAGECEGDELVSHPKRCGHLRFPMVEVRCTGEGYQELLASLPAGEPVSSDKSTETRSFFEECQEWCGLGLPFSHLWGHVGVCDGCGFLHMLENALRSNESEASMAAAGSASGDEDEHEDTIHGTMQEPIHPKIQKPQVTTSEGAEPEQSPSFFELLCTAGGDGGDDDLDSLSGPPTWLAVAGAGCPGMVAEVLAFDDFC
ncbi:unnamed protein product [Symbiodinium sp. KB8]|nr:unnamed protein product [Symbiodinium sp. KB8]